MSVSVILFDLDGTLLPMDHAAFGPSYFQGIDRYMQTHGRCLPNVGNVIRHCYGKMLKNNGPAKNVEVFWEAMKVALGEDILSEVPVFEKFYEDDFPKLRSTCGFDPTAAPTVRCLKEMGYRVALATNPIFPPTATEQRVAWAGLSHTEFELFTNYETSCFSKPNPKYYLEVCEMLGVSPEDCLMVGNDVQEDMVAQTVGMKVFLLPKYLLNKSNEDISCFPQGVLSDIPDYVKTL